VKDLRHKLGMAVVWITHDLGVVAGIADRVMVMYGGQVVESAGVDALYENPTHPYTRALMATLPSLDGTRRDRLMTIAGQPPLLTAPPAACPFAPRCAHVHDRCRMANPPLIEVVPGHAAACWLAAPGEGVQNGV